MRRIVLLLGIVLALAGSAALADEYGSPPSTPGTPVAQAASPAPEASPLSVIHIKNFAFVPATVTIPPGSTVRWVQDDEAAHTVTASDKSFDSGNLDQKATYKHTFATAGTYTYVCAYHSMMKGTVIVK